MNEKLKSIWKKSFKGPSGLVLAFTVLASAIFVVLFALGLMSARNNSNKDLLIFSLLSSIGIAAASISIFALFRWAFCRQNIRRTLFALACFATAIALFYTEENWRGKHAWDKYKREWEAKGEQFDVANFIPPSVPDEQNFALTPLLKPIYDFAHGANAWNVHWNDTNGLKHLHNVRADLPPNREKNHLALGSLDKSTFADLELCRDFYRGNTNYPQPATSGTAAEDILFALGKFDKEMKELTEAARNRPYSRFPIRYDAEPPSGILLPHLAYMKGLCELFQMRAVARLETGQNDGALDDLKVGFRLSDSMRDEPFLIDHLVRLATCSANLQTLREGLVRHAWNDEQLADLEKYFGSLNLLAELKHAMRGERAMNIAGVDYIRRQGLGAEPTDYMDETGGAQKTGSGFGFMPSGWLYQNMLAIARMHQQFTIGGVDEKQHRVFPEKAKEQRKAIETLKKGFYPYTIFARLLMPAYGATCRKAGRAQTLVDAASVACALERFRLANGNYPETLNALLPNFIEKIPTDVIDGRLLRYKKDLNGSYLLYSIGWNQSDDGGEIVFAKGDTPSIDASRGDWVWKNPEN